MQPAVRSVQSRGSIEPASLRLLAISGSLRIGSTNTAALSAMQALAPAEIAIVLFDGLAGLPHFNPDLDRDPLPATVTEFRAEVARADGVVISSPEYARGVPGTLKNALDWLVSGPEFPDKPVALINTSPRASHAQAQLALTLKTMSGRLIEAACVTLPLLGRPWSAEDIAADAALAATLREALQRFAEVVDPSFRAQ